MFDNSKAAPANVVLEELLEGKKASREQKMRMLENRRELIVRCMSSFSQKTLGQLACLDSGNGSYHELREDKPNVVSLDGEFRLDTRGFFAGNSLCKRTRGSWECTTFGIDSRSWLLVKTSYIQENITSGYEKALSVRVIPTELLSILEEVGIEPDHIWKYFFRMVTEDWVSDRRKLYDEACRVAQGMKEEDAIFRMIA
ncbi:MAG: hypothetical protein WC791_01160 [Candidatus Paceibacterota bacterium]